MHGCKTSVVQDQHVGAGLQIAVLTSQLHPALGQALDFLRWLKARLLNALCRRWRILLILGGTLIGLGLNGFTKQGGDHRLIGQPAGQWKFLLLNARCQESEPRACQQSKPYSHQHKTQEESYWSSPTGGAS